MEAKEEAIEARAETTRPKIEKWKTLGQSEYNVFKTGYTNYMLGKKEDQRPYAFLTEEVKADLKVLALGRTMKPEFSIIPENSNPAGNSNMGKSNFASSNLRSGALTPEKK